MTVRGFSEPIASPLTSHGPHVQPFSYDEYHGLSGRLGISTEVMCLGHDGTVLAHSEFLRSQYSLAPHGTATNRLSPIRPDALNNGLTNLRRTLLAGKNAQRPPRPRIFYIGDSIADLLPQRRFIDYGK